MDDGAEVNLLFFCRLCFITDDDVKEFIPGMIVSLVHFNLAFQRLDGRFNFLRAGGLGLEHQEVVFHVVVDAAYPPLVIDLLLIIGKFVFQSPGSVGSLQRVAYVRGKIQGPKT